MDHRCIQTKKRHSEVELWRFVELYKGGEAAGRSHAA